MRSQPSFTGLLLKYKIDLEWGVGGVYTSENKNEKEGGFSGLLTSGKEEAQAPGVRTLNAFYFLATFS